MIGERHLAAPQFGFDQAVIADRGDRLVPNLVGKALSGGIALDEIVQRGAGGRPHALVGAIGALHIEIDVLPVHLRKPRQHGRIERVASGAKLDGDHLKGWIEQAALDFAPAVIDRRLERQGAGPCPVGEIPEGAIALGIAGTRIRLVKRVFGCPEQIKNGHLDFSIVGRVGGIDDGRFRVAVHALQGQRREGRNCLARCLAVSGRSGCQKHQKYQ